MTSSTPDSTPHPTPTAKPGWVHWALLGIPGRGSAVALLWITYVCGGLFAGVQFIEDRAALGILIALVGLGSGIWIQQAVQWMDENKRWSHA